MDVADAAGKADVNVLMLQRPSGGQSASPAPLLMNEKQITNFVLFMPLIKYI